MPALTLTVNGVEHALDVPAGVSWPKSAGDRLTGTKIGCNGAECGACRHRRFGRSVDSCSPRLQGPGRRVLTTIEGGRNLGGTPISSLQSPNLGRTEIGGGTERIDPLQRHAYGATTRLLHAEDHAVKTLLAPTTTPATTDQTPSQGHLPLR